MKPFIKSKLKYICDECLNEKCSKIEVKAIDDITITTDTSDIKIELQLYIIKNE